MRGIGDWYENAQATATPLLDCPDGSVELSYPLPISDRLDALVSLAEASGERTSALEGSDVAAIGRSPRLISTRDRVKSHLTFTHCVTTCLQRESMAPREQSEKESDMTGDPNDLLSVLVAGERNIDVLADGRILGSMAQVVLMHAKAGGADVLVAASPSAERLVGAALMLAPDEVRGLRSTDSVSNNEVVLVIDVNLASGASMATAARQVRRQGAQHVLGAVMHFLDQNVPTAHDCGLDLLSELGTPADLP